MRRTLLLAALLTFIPALTSAETHKFKPTAGVQTFAVRPPVLRVRPGDTVETETFSRPGDYYDRDKAGPWPGEVGPFHIEGAALGDTLVVRILKLAPTATWRSRRDANGIAESPATAAPHATIAAAAPFRWKIDRGASEILTCRIRSKRMMAAAASGTGPVDGRWEAWGRPLAGRLRRQPDALTWLRARLTDIVLCAIFYSGFHALQATAECGSDRVHSGSDVAVDVIKGTLRWPRIEMTIPSWWRQVRPPSTRCESLRRADREVTSTASTDGGHQIA